MNRISISSYLNWGRPISQGVVLIACCSLFVTVSVLAFADPLPVSLYDGETIANASSSIGPWGGGAVSDTDKATYTEGKRSLLITTLGPYEGALFTLNPVLSVGDVVNDKTRYITIALTIKPSSAPTPGESPGSTLPDQIGSTGTRSLVHLAQMQGPGPFTPSMLPPWMQRGGVTPPFMQPGGPMRPGYQPRPGQRSGVGAPPPPLNYVRAVITTDTGATAECVEPVPQPSGTSTWATVSFPLSRFSLPSGEAADLKVKSVMLAGDLPVHFYLGYARIVTDAQPLVASIQGNDNISPGSTTKWSFLVNAGVSNIRWDWKSDDGSQVEHGKSFTHTFAKSGEYHVTLTVRDVDGIKAPVTTQMKILVQDH